MSGQINTRNFGWAKQTSPKYLSDQISGAYLGYWTTTGVMGQSFVDKMPGDAICSLYANIMTTGRFDWIFNEPKNLRGYYVDFWAKASNDLALLIYTIAGIADFTSYTRRDQSITTSWARYLVPIDTTFSAKGGNKEVTIVRNKSLALYNNGVPSDIYLSGFHLRRL